MARPIVVPGANGSVGKTEVSSAEPPPSAAGFVQSTSPVVGRPGPLSVFGRPNIGSFGTGASKVEKAMTQPNCFALRQPGMFLKSPPTLPPSRTVTLPPSRIAEISRLRTFLFRSMSWWIELTQHEAALGVADQNHAAALVVLAQVGLPGGGHVPVGDLLRVGRD